MNYWSTVDFCLSFLSNVSLILKKVDIYIWPFTVICFLKLDDKFININCSQVVIQFRKDNKISKQLKSQIFPIGHHIENQY